MARKTSNPDAWVAYKNRRNDVKSEIRSAERAFAADQIMSNPNNFKPVVEDYLIVYSKEVCHFESI